VPFTVPVGYFDQFPHNLLELIEHEKMNEVPNGYFDQFAFQMLQKIRSNEAKEELDAISPFLNTLSKKMPFSLPEGYFEQSLQAILKETSHPPAKAVTMGRASRWKQWAAAASIIFALGLGWQFFVNKPKVANLTALVNPAAVDTLLTGIDATSLSGYLETEQANSEFTSLLSMAQLDIETGLKQLSTEDLKWYLENQDVNIPGT
jgi:hypothetical protein